MSFWEMNLFSKLDMVIVFRQNIIQLVIGSDVIYGHFLDKYSAD